MQRGLKPALRLDFLGKTTPKTQIANATGPANSLEVSVLATPLHYRTRPRALRVILPLGMGR
jgi:hypothetical protein